MCEAVVFAVKALAAQWRNVRAQTDIDKQKFNLPDQDKEDSTFRLKYDEIQRQLKNIAGMDDLLLGLFSNFSYNSKSCKPQVGYGMHNRYSREVIKPFNYSAVTHAVFHWLNSFLW